MHPGIGSILNPSMTHKTHVIQVGSVTPSTAFLFIEINRPQGGGYFLFGVATGTIQPIIYYKL